MKFLDEDIEFNFEVDIGGFRTKTERYYEFIGSNGSIYIDVINSKMTLNLNDNLEIIDLQGDGSSHSGGDYFVMSTLFDLLNSEKVAEIPTFNEAIRATHIGLLIEESALKCNKIIYKI